MNFFKSLRGEFVDIIEWLDSTNETIVHRFERHDNEIKNGAKLIVRESQIAVLVDNGKFADVFEPGSYELKTENLPILSTLKGWKYGFDSPFKVEVYFLSTKNITNRKWGTPNEITKRDPEFGIIQLRAFGSYTFRVTEPKLFLTEVAGTDHDYTADEIDEQLLHFIVTEFSDALAEANIAALDLIANLRELSDLCQGRIESSFAQYGLEINNFLISNINFPDEVQEAISKRASMTTVGNLNDYQKYQSGKAIENASNNPGGGSDAINMGLGFGMANQMMNNQNQQPSTGQTPPTPPPVPSGISVFVAVNGQQNGPYNEAQLKQMISQNQFTKDSMVWMEGMSGWQSAGEVEATNKLFGNTPPPIPS